MVNEVDQRQQLAEQLLAQAKEQGIDLLARRAAQPVDEERVRDGRWPRS